MINDGNDTATAENFTAAFGLHKGESPFSELVRRQ